MLIKILRRDMNDCVIGDSLLELHVSICVSLFECERLVCALLIVNTFMTIVSAGVA